MRASIGLTIFALAAAPALAQPPEGPAAPEAAERSAGTVTPSVDEATPIDGADRKATLDGDGVLSSEELGELRGGEAVVIQHTTQTLTATNTGNSVTGDSIGSGAVNLSSNAFQGYDGIGNFVINTGHNNNLQGSISVNITMTPQ